VTSFIEIPALSKDISRHVG